MRPVENFEKYEKELKENIKSLPIPPLVTIFNSMLTTHTNTLHIHAPYNMESWMNFLIFNLSIVCGKPPFRHV